MNDVFTWGDPVTEEQAAELKGSSFYGRKWEVGDEMAYFMIAIPKEEQVAPDSTETEIIMSLQINVICKAEMEQFLEETAFVTIKKGNSVDFPVFTLPELADDVRLWFPAEEK